MLKPKQFLLSLSLSLSLSLGISLLAFNPLLFADETLTITTYYPSPYGTYNQLQANQLSVGDTNGDGNMTSADLPNNNGNIRLAAHTAAPPTETGLQGEIAYASDGYLYVNNGSSTWVKQGGGGASFTYYCNFATDTLPIPSNICTNAGGTRGYCPAGFRQIYDLGSWGLCTNIGGYATELWSFFRPPGGGCPSGWPVYSYGEAYVCSQ